MHHFLLSGVELVGQQVLQEVVEHVVVLGISGGRVDVCGGV